MDMREESREEEGGERKDEMAAMVDGVGHLQGR